MAKFEVVPLAELKTRLSAKLMPLVEEYKVCSSDRWPFGQRFKRANRPAGTAFRDFVSRRSLCWGVTRWDAFRSKTAPRLTPVLGDRGRIPFSTSAYPFVDTPRGPKVPVSGRR